jgi:hypothetical protein
LAVVVVPVPDVVVVDEPVPELCTLDPVVPLDGGGVVEGAGWDPPEAMAGATAPDSGLVAAGGGGVAGADVVEVTVPPDPPPPGLPPPPLEDGTGDTPGQAWPKATAGVTAGFVALGLSGPGSR